MNTQLIKCPYKDKCTDRYLCGSCANNPGEGSYYQPRYPIIYPVTYYPWYPMPYPELPWYYNPEPSSVDW